MFERNILAPSRIIGLYTMSDIIIFFICPWFVAFIVIYINKFLNGSSNQYSKGLDWKQPYMLIEVLISVEIYIFRYRSKINLRSIANCTVLWRTIQWVLDTTQKRPLLKCGTHVSLETLLFFSYMAIKK
jgi:hypothetical protein